MTSRPVAHSTFSVDRIYDAAPARVFAAWASPAAKARWFACHPEHSLDFRVGGREFARGGEAGGPVYTTEILYHDIVPNHRIVYTYTLLADDHRKAVGLVTVQFEPEGSGTRLIVTEQGAYLDTAEVPGAFEDGLKSGLERLAVELGQSVAA
jgi:uncharacterized protein YndB with AHSA1/START domain